MEALFHHRAFVFSGHFCPKTLGSTKMELGHFPTCSCGLLCPISIWIFRWGFQEQSLSLLPCSGWPASHASKRPDYKQRVGNTFCKSDFLSDIFRSLLDSLMYLKNYSGGPESCGAALKPTKFFWSSGRCSWDKTASSVERRLKTLWSHHHAKASVCTSHTSLSPVTEISRGSALVTDGRSAPVQRCLWDPGGFLPIEECGQVWLQGVTWTKWPVMEKEEKDWAWEMPCTVLQSLDMLPPLSENSFRDAQKGSQTTQWCCI